MCASGGTSLSAAKGVAAGETTPFAAPGTCHPFAKVRCTRRVRFTMGRQRIANLPPFGVFAPLPRQQRSAEATWFPRRRLPERPMNRLWCVVESTRYLDRPKAKRRVRNGRQRFAKRSSLRRILEGVIATVTGGLILWSVTSSMSQPAPVVQATAAAIAPAAEAEAACRKFRTFPAPAAPATCERRGAGGRASDGSRSDSHTGGGRARPADDCLSPDGGHRSEFSEFAV